MSYLLFNHSDRLRECLLLLVSFGTLFFLPPTTSPWHPTGILACSGLIWSWAHFPWPRLAYTLDRLSNTHGRPPWFVRPIHCWGSPTPPLLYELPHWHNDWSLGDSLFWLLMLFLQLGYLVGWWFLFFGAFFILATFDDWVQWCSGSSHPSSGGFSFISLSILLLCHFSCYLSQGRSILMCSWLFLRVDIPTSFWNMLGNDTIASLHSDLDALLGDTSSSLGTDRW